MLGKYARRCAGPCSYHEDVFVLAVPTKHVGLVLGKGKANVVQIFSSSGLSRLTVPRILGDKDCSLTETEVELQGAGIAFQAA